MGKFNLSSENKNNIAREVKHELIRMLNHTSYAELNVFYDDKKENFFVDKFGDREKLEHEGYCFYKFIGWDTTNKKPTIKDLKEIIFN